MKVTAVVGNPKPRSRTYAAARLLAQHITGHEPDMLDLVDLGPALLMSGTTDPTVAESVRSAVASDVLIVASPTFKATYTGLLKLFLELLATGDGLAGTIAVPLMLSADPAHALAPELFLKPVLVEVGATCPTPGLCLRDSTYDEDGRLAAFASRWSATVRVLAGAELAEKS